MLGHEGGESGLKRAAVDNQWVGGLGFVAKGKDSAGLRCVRVKIGVVFGKKVGARWVKRMRGVCNKGVPCWPTRHAFIVFAVWGATGGGASSGPFLSRFFGMNGGGRGGGEVINFNGLFSILNKMLYLCSAKRMPAEEEGAEGGRRERRVVALTTQHTGRRPDRRRRNARRRQKPGVWFAG